jgi:hypothetical protein
MLAADAMWWWILALKAQPHGLAKLHRRPQMAKTPIPGGLSGVRVPQAGKILTGCRKSEYATHCHLPMIIPRLVSGKMLIG